MNILAQLLLVFEYKFEKSADWFVTGCIQTPSKMAFKMSKYSIQGNFQWIERLTGPTFVWLTGENSILDPLAVQRIDNRLNDLLNWTTTSLKVQ